MSDQIIACPCGFKAVSSQIHKTSGYCPRCGTMLIEGLEDLHATKKKTKEELNELIKRQVK